MNLLLDTHVLIWWYTSESSLSKPARDAIRLQENTVFVSSVVVWEMMIKRARKKLTFPDNLETLLVEENFSILPVTLPHALAIDSLPGIHQDPFDRMLVAQAIVENLILVTRDKHIMQYSVECIEA